MDSHGFSKRMFVLLDRLAVGTVSGKKLAKAAGISVRQLYRDIDYLRAIGFDIPGEAGLGFAMHLAKKQPPKPPVFIRDIDHMKVVMLMAAGWRWRGHLTSEFFADVFQMKKQRVTRTMVILRELGYNIPYRKGHGYQFVSGPQ